METKKNILPNHKRKEIQNMIITNGTGIGEGSTLLASVAVDGAPSSKYIPMASSRFPPQAFNNFLAVSTVAPVTLTNCSILVDITDS